MYRWLKRSIWAKVLLLPSGFYFTIIVACIVAFVPVAFQETISKIVSLIELKALLQVGLFFVFTGTVIYMGNRFIGFAMFSKYVSDRVNKQGQGLKSEADKQKFLIEELLPTVESKNKNAFKDIVAAIMSFIVASVLLVIMVAVN